MEWLYEELKVHMNNIYLLLPVTLIRITACVQLS